MSTDSTQVQFTLNEEDVQDPYKTIDWFEGWEHPENFENYIFKEYNDMTYGVDNKTPFVLQIPGFNENIGTQDEWVAKQLEKDSISQSTHMNYWSLYDEYGDRYKEFLKMIQNHNKTQAGKYRLVLPMHPKDDGAGNQIYTYAFEGSPTNKITTLENSIQSHYKKSKLVLNTKTGEYVEPEVLVKEEREQNKLDLYGDELFPIWKKYYENLSKFSEDYEEWKDKINLDLVKKGDDVPSYLQDDAVGSDEASLNWANFNQHAKVFFTEDTKQAGLYVDELFGVKGVTASTMPSIKLEAGHKQLLEWVVANLKNGAYYKTNSSLRDDISRIEGILKKQNDPGFIMSIDIHKKDELENAESWGIGEAIATSSIKFIGLISGKDSATRLSHVKDYKTYKSFVRRVPETIDRITKNLSNYTVNGRRPNKVRMFVDKNPSLSSIQYMIGSPVSYTAHNGFKVAFNDLLAIPLFEDLTNEWYYENHDAVGFDKLDFAYWLRSHPDPKYSSTDPDDDFFSYYEILHMGYSAWKDDPANSPIGHNNYLSTMEFTQKDLQDYSSITNSINRWKLFEERYGKSKGGFLEFMCTNYPQVAINMYQLHSNLRNVENYMTSGDFINVLPPAQANRIPILLTEIYGITDNNDNPWDWKNMSSQEAEFLEKKPEMFDDLYTPPPASNW
ncbi:MAG: hypothetical protein Tp1123DCM939791_37 [Prokaryotic dsDNA virus sp.]|nr:MAG: hypothetical protein Tp1123DCM939791_37 [Prokaryotic dsDNA virus sp.]|tara:strand:- start:27364 stop:29379 length:2016 start_codon:yes stop_codon:yes gene_type:complete